MWPKIQKLLGCRLVGYEYVLILRDGKSDYYIVLNHAGSRAFSLMDGRSSVEEIAAVLEADAHKPAAAFHESVRNLVAELERLGVVTSRPDPWPEPYQGFLRQVPGIQADSEPPTIDEMKKLELVAGHKETGVCRIKKQACHPQGLTGKSCK